MIWEEDRIQRVARYIISLYAPACAKVHPDAPVCTKMHPDYDCIKVRVQSHNPRSKDLGFFSLFKAHVSLLQVLVNF